MTCRTELPTYAGIPANLSSFFFITNRRIRSGGHSVPKNEDVSSVRLEGRPFAAVDRGINDLAEGRKRLGYRIGPGG